MRAVTPMALVDGLLVFAAAYVSLDLAKRLEVRLKGETVGWRWVRLRSAAGLPVRQADVSQGAGAVGDRRCGPAYDEFPRLAVQGDAACRAVT